MNARKPLEVGDIALTPFPPHGAVVITAISPDQFYGRQFADVVMLHPHYGYAPYSTGGYLLSDLLPIDNELGDMIAAAVTDPATKRHLVKYKVYGICPCGDHLNEPNGRGLCPTCIEQWEGARLNG